MGIGDIAAVDTEPILEDEDSEAEDDIIKPSDNLILVGHVEDDSASLEVYSKLKKQKHKIQSGFIYKFYFQFIMSKKIVCTFIMIFYYLVFLFA